MALMPLGGAGFLRQSCGKGTWQFMFFTKLNDIEGWGPTRKDGNWLVGREFV